MRPKDLKDRAKLRWNAIKMYLGDNGGESASWVQIAQGKIKLRTS